MAACYSPSLPDCAVACASSADCGPGQTCGADGLCAAPDLSCTPLGGTPGPGEPRPDGPPPPDAPGDAPPADPTKVILRVRVDRGGKVLVQGQSACAAQGAMPGDCHYTVPPSAPLQLQAVPLLGYSFDRWTSNECDHQGALCQLTPALSYTEVRARFKQGGDDDDDDAAAPRGE